MRHLFLITSVLLSGLVPVAANGDDLAGIRKIYLGDFGTDQYAGLVREKMRAELVKSERFIVVEKVEDAEAVLTGSAGMAAGYRARTDSNGGSGTTVYQGYGVLRLIHVGTSEPVWFFEYKPSIWVFRNGADQVAKQLVEKLMKAAPPYKGPRKGSRQDEATGETKQP